jgi:hypothetical protein
MNDSVLLMTGIGVFGLMVIAIVMTVLEFKQLGERQRRARRSGGESLR